MKRRDRSIRLSTKPTKEHSVSAPRDESISSASTDDEGHRHATSAGNSSLFSKSEDEDETGAERRLRLAEQYLQKLKTEVDEIGFDAEDIDRDLVAARLQEDAAESKGRLYKQITSTLSFSTAVQTLFRVKTLSMTSIATCKPYVYTVSKDLQITKWELRPPSPTLKLKRTLKPVRRRPLKLINRGSDKRRFHDPNYKHHIAPILCIAASTTGKYVATGGADKRLIIWSADTLTPLCVFTQHRDAVTSLSFRKGTNQLYSASKDRTIKCWSLDELAYIETLFGHQDEVVDVASLAAERCVSVGARDRTARLWKVVEETQLVFRGGGSSDKRKSQGQKKGFADVIKNYSEGSMDRVAMIDEDMFVTGSDNGSLSLWALHKKKPIFSVALAHGLDPPLTREEVSAEAVPNVELPERLPRWITALATVPYSDLVLSGSWDGEVRVWKISEDKRRLEAVGIVGRSQNVGGKMDTVVQGEEAGKERKSIKGIINDISVVEHGDRGKEGLCIVVAVGTEPRMGRWKKVRGMNGAAVFEVRKIHQLVKDDVEKNEMMQKVT